MAPQYTLDVASGDAIVIVTRAATLRVDCHRMDGDWSLLLQYPADGQPPTVCNEQSPKQSTGDLLLAKRSPQRQIPKGLPPDGPSPVPRELRSDEQAHKTDAACILDGDQRAEDRESIEPGVIRKLGDLPPDAVISEDGLAKLFGRHRVSIRRAVRRGELPPDIRLFGESAWTIEALRNHTNKRLEAARKDAERLQQRISRLRP